jgi:hypothetical protein
VSDSYQKALDDARRELDDLPRQRQLTAQFYDEREAQLETMIEGLTPLCETGQSAPDSYRLLDFIASVGLQEAIESVIYANSPNPLEPTQVRDGLERAGVNTKGYSNPMATIHRALKRLEDSPDSPVRCHVVNGKRLYGWVPTGEQLKVKPRWFEVMKQEAIRQGKPLFGISQETIAKSVEGLKKPVTGFSGVSGNKLSDLKKLTSEDFKKKV